MILYLFYYFLYFLFNFEIIFKLKSSLLIKKQKLKKKWTDLIHHRTGLN